MAKRRKPARGAGGKFTKSRSARTTTAIVVAAPRAPARRRRPSITVRRAAAPARRRRSSVARVGGTGAGNFTGSLKARIKPLGASAVYAWIMNGDANTTPGKIKATLDKVPVVSAIGRHATHGILAALVASRTQGRVREAFDLLATAALHRAAYNIGAANFSIEKAATVSGWDGTNDGELSGSIGDDEGLGYDDMGYED
jgi:hypothetical protein